MEIFQNMELAQIQDKPYNQVHKILHGMLDDHHTEMHFLLESLLDEIDEVEKK